jgi:RND superfamily putative drug exporter
MTDLADRVVAGRPSRDVGGMLGRFVSRYAVWIILLWLVCGGVLTLTLPQLERVVESHSRAFIPDDSASSIAERRAAALLGEEPSNNINYLVLERDQPLTAADHQYYDKLVAAMRADTEQVGTVTDLWSDPETAVAAQSADGRAVIARMRLSGMIGASEANESVAAVREMIKHVGPPPGLNVYLTGPGATISDEFAAIDQQLLRIIIATVAMILALLLIVYRSPVGAAIPLISVGLALAVARPIIAALGESGVLAMSLFSVALLAAMILGAGTDYAIFLIGRYREGRSAGLDPDESLLGAYRGVAPVIVGSALTIAAALVCLSFARLGVFRSTGIPCAIGILVAMLASMSLTPALITLAGRRRWLEPKPSQLARRWRRIGVSVARWPGPILVASGAVILIAALPLAGLRIGWNEPASAPPSIESNRGYQAIDRHFPVNTLVPAVVTISADHDIRNPAGLIAVERISKQLMAVPGVRMVQSASRPAGVVPDEVTFSGLAGVIGRQLNTAVDSVTGQLGRIGDLDSVLGAMSSDITRLSAGLQGSASGLRGIGSAAEDVQGGMAGLQTNLTTVSGYLDPLRAFVAQTPDCPNNPLCSAVSKVVQPVDDLVHSSDQIASGTNKLTAGAGTATDSLAGLPAAVNGMAAQIQRARSATTDLTNVMKSVGPQVHQLTDYLQEIDTQFRGSAAGGFYMPQRALQDPRLKAALDKLMSPDGRSTYLLVYGEGQEWGADGARRSAQLESAVHEATKEGTLRPTAVYLAGVGPATLDLQHLVRSDLKMLSGITLLLIFLIVAVMLRSPVAGIVVVGTVTVSYASALGASVLIWQHLLHHQLHWAVIPISFIALVAVGADYNLLLSLRIREEATAGLSTGIVRAFAATGGVVTTAGIVFGMTMFALAASSVLSVAQIGVTVGVGLLLDTLIVRTFVLPSIVALLGRWFWWPTPVVRKARPVRA